MDRSLRQIIPEFAAPSTEHIYRQWRLPEISGYARFAVAIGSGANLLLLFNDYLFWGLRTEFWLLATLRWLTSGLGFALVILLRRPLPVRIFDNGMFAWMLGMWIMSVAAGALRPPGFLASALVAQTVVFAGYLFVPLRYWQRLACGIGGAAAFLGMLVLTQAVTLAALLPLFLAMIIANLIGAIASLQLERLRRLEFARLEDARDANERLRQIKQALEHANQTKSRFLAMVSHEIRTPMNGVFGILQLLDDGSLDLVQQRYLKTAQDSAEALVGLLDTILDYVRFEGGHQAFEAEDFDLHRMVESVAALLRVRAEAKGLSLSVAIDIAPPALLRGDVVRLRQVLINLVSNAIKFTAAGGVSIAATLEPPSAAGQTGLRIAVTDTGIGIAPEMQQTIFDEFAQADDSIARQFGGTGLGLAICREIVALMQGQIEVESRIGAGSTFKVRVPLTRSDASFAQAPPTSDLRLSRKLLLVEDDPVNQAVAAGLLQQLGHQVLAVRSGAEAMAALASQSFDLILMDLHLPGIDGFETTRRIRAQPEPDRAAVAIIALSADVTADTRRRCREAGMLTLVSKPVLRSALQAAIAGLALAHDDSDRRGEALVIDRVYLKEQWESLGSLNLQKVSRIFQRSSRDLVAAIEAAVSKADRRAIGELAHRLRSASGTLGLVQLRAIASQVEVQAPTASAEELAMVIRELAAVRAASLRALIAVERELRRARLLAANF